MANLQNQPPLYEDITIATVGGTTSAGGLLQITITKAAQLTTGGFLSAMLMSTGYMVTPVSGSENGQTATVTVYEPAGSAQAMIPLASSAALIGTKIRVMYYGS